VKSLLILYPIQPYADALIWEKAGIPKADVRYAKMYQELIRKRYPDFQMVCVMFSAPENPAKPDISQLWRGFSVNGNDIIGACGVTFRDHCWKHVYPKASKILDLCPEPVDELVVTGFHLWDCVDKVAKYAHKKGISVSVEEDLTELFFYSIKSSGGIPILQIPISKRESLEQTQKQLEKAGEYFLEHARAERKKRPWMAQI
jgi:hypothetical protein